MPERIQRRRVKGWRMPPNTVYVGRPSVFGNPFAATDLGVGLFIEWLNGKSFHNLNSGENIGKERRDKLIARLPELRGKDLACWCPLDRPCHAYVLLKIANGQGA